MQRGKRASCSENPKSLCHVRFTYGRRCYNRLRNCWQFKHAPFETLHRCPSNRLKHTLNHLHNSTQQGDPYSIAAANAHHVVSGILHQYLCCYDVVVLMTHKQSRNTVGSFKTTVVFLFGEQPSWWFNLGFCNCETMSLLGSQA